MEEKNSIEISKLEDSRKKLRYLISGLTCTCNKYWHCDINCPITPTQDDERLDSVINFIKTYNISYDTFLYFSFALVKGHVYKYHGTKGNLFKNLEVVLSLYGINCPENEFEDVLNKDNEILNLLMDNEMNSEEKNQYSYLDDLAKTYNIDLDDFLVISKTILNYGIPRCDGFERKDLYLDIKNFIAENNLGEDYEVFKEMQKSRKEEVKEIEEKGILKRIKSIFK